MTFEHRDITPERRPEYPGPKTHERVKTPLFFDLMKEALINYGSAQSGRLKLPKSDVHDIGFFFKKAWDDFVEPVLEYNDLAKTIEEKQWESKGAKSRAMTALKEQKEEIVTALKDVLPDLEIIPDPQLMDQKKLKKALARVYEGYASYINSKKAAFEKIVAESSEERDIGTDLGFLLGVWGRASQ